MSTFIGNRHSYDIQDVSIWYMLGDMLPNAQTTLTISFRVNADIVAANAFKLVEITAATGFAIGNDADVSINSRRRDRSFPL